MYEVLNMSTDAKNINNLTYTDYYYRLMLMARNVYAWENLPNGIDEKWIERYLFAEGQCMFFFDETFGFMVARCNVNDNLNEQDEPTVLIPVATNYIPRAEGYRNFMGRKIEGAKPKDQCVLIRNNDIMIPTARTIKLFAMRLTEIQRTIDINIHAQRTPVLVRCQERTRLTLKNIYKQWQGNEPVIFGDKSLDDNEAFNVLRTDAPVVFPQLQVQSHSVWNEAMTFIGVNNANMDKRERLVDDEVQANNQQIQLSASIGLKARERACDLINELYNDDLKGKKVSVRMRSKNELEAIITSESEGIKNVC